MLFIGSRDKCYNKIEKKQKQRSDWVTVKARCYRVATTPFFIAFTPSKSTLHQFFSYLKGDEEGGLYRPRPSEQHQSQNKRTNRRLSRLLITQRIMHPTKIDWNRFHNIFATSGDPLKCPRRRSLQMLMNSGRSSEHKVGRNKNFRLVI